MMIIYPYLIPHPLPPPPRGRGLFFNYLYLAGFYDTLICFLKISSFDLYAHKSPSPGRWFLSLSKEVGEGYRKNIINL